MVENQLSSTSCHRVPVKLYIRIVKSGTDHILSSTAAINKESWQHLLYQRTNDKDRRLGKKDIRITIDPAWDCNLGGGVGWIGLYNFVLIIISHHICLDSPTRLTVPDPMEFLLCLCQ